jgi:hypothetical protein
LKLEAIAVREVNILVAGNYLGGFQALQVIRSYEEGKVGEIIDKSFIVEFLVNDDGGAHGELLNDVYQCRCDVCIGQGGFPADAFGETDKRMEAESVSLRLSALSPFEAGCGLTIASIAPIRV